jgi:hypothetical protein
MEADVETKPAYGIEELAKAGPLGRSSLFKAIKEKKLIAQKAGRRTIITHENYEAFLRSLPIVGGEVGSHDVRLGESSLPSRAASEGQCAIVETAPNCSARRR